MNIQIYKKNTQLSPRQEEYILKKISGIEKVFENILSVKVDVTTDAHHKKGDIYTVTAQVTIPGKKLVGEETQGTIEAAVDLVEQELISQLRRRKEKRKSIRLKKAHKAENQIA